jgi:hypothetical protein
MKSNYPPGVSGNEWQIAGFKEFCKDWTCPECLRFFKDQLFLHDGQDSWTECEFCAIECVYEMEN